MEKEIHAGVLTVSTKGFLGKRSDESGEIATRMLEREGIFVVKERLSLMIAIGLPRPL